MPHGHIRAESFSGRYIMGLEDEADVFLEPRQKRHIGVEIWAMAYLAVLFQIKNGSPLRP